MKLEELKNGDLILIQDLSTTGLMGIFLSLIRYFSNSNYTHIGILVTNPKFGEKELEGTYVWESGYEGIPDPQDGKVKLGVQLTHINDFVLNNQNKSKFTIRRFENNECFTTENLKKIHKKVYDKPYDINILDWLEAADNIDFDPRKTSCFWCSAFVGYVLTQLGLLTSETDWSKLKPCDFSLDYQNIDYPLQSKNKLKLEEFELVFN